MYWAAYALGRLCTGPLMRKALMYRLCAETLTVRRALLYGDPLRAQSAPLCGDPRRTQSSPRGRPSVCAELYYVETFTLRRAPPPPCMGATVYWALTVYSSSLSAWSAVAWHTLGSSQWTLHSIWIWLAKPNKNLTKLASIIQRNERKNARTNVEHEC
jgi:hypothetical protein